MSRRAVAAARGWIGTPYMHQAARRGVGADCLGLIRGVWEEIVGGVPETMPAYTADWAEPRGEEVLMAAANRHLVRRPAGAAGQAGDVLLFRMRERGIAKHLGIAAETGARPTFVHAYGGHAVIESALTAPWARRIAARYGWPPVLGG